ncbi:MAG: peptidoglycan editing factor PgeF [Campylobacterales bacterium]
MIHSHRHDGNMGLHIGDDPAQVINNRTSFLAKHGLLLEQLVIANQLHGDRIALVGADDRGKGSDDHATAIADTDALITQTPGVALGILTADCVPILLYDPIHQAIGAIHAGWRGTALQITTKTIHAMQHHFGSIPSHLHAFIGPAIGPCCYEVGAETASACGCHGASHLDLKELNRQQLLAAGVADEAITVSNLCTSCRNDILFSHRADGGKSGRLLSVIAMRPSCVK